MIAQGLFVIAFALSLLLVVASAFVGYWLRSWRFAVFVASGAVMMCLTFPLSLGGSLVWALHIAVVVAGLVVAVVASVSATKLWLWPAGLFAGAVLVAWWRREHLPNWYVWHTQAMARIEAEVRQ